MTKHTRNGRQGRPVTPESRRGILAGLVALVLLGGYPQASAYVLQEDGHGHPIYWDSAPVTYWLVEGNAPEGAAGEEAVHRAFQSWDAASDNVEYRFGGYVAAGTSELDGRNVVYWIHEDWPYDPSLVAVTFHYYDTRDGHLLDADIVFNGERFHWTTGGSGYDVENAATHEVGHFGGLGHSDDPEATMYGKTAAGETKKATLEADDVAGLDALYGGTWHGSAGVFMDGASGMTGGSGGGGCHVGGRAPDWRGLVDVWWTAMLLTVPIALRRRRR